MGQRAGNSGHAPPTLYRHPALRPHFARAREGLQALGQQTKRRYPTARGRLEFAPIIIRIDEAVARAGQGEKPLIDALAARKSSTARAIARPAGDDDESSRRQCHGGGEDRCPPCSVDGAGSLDTRPASTFARVARICPASCFALTTKTSGLAPKSAMSSSARTLGDASEVYRRCGASTLRWEMIIACLMATQRNNHGQPSRRAPLTRGVLLSR